MVIQWITVYPGGFGVVPSGAKQMEVMMPVYRYFVVIALVVVFAVIGCGKEEPPTPAAYPAGYPQQVPGAYPQQPVGTQPVQPVQPGAQPVQPVQPTVPVQVPGQPVQVGGVQISWQSLSQALPTNAPGWVMSGQVEGESAVIMGMAFSRAGCNLRQGNMTAKVDIVDTSMNPMMAMPFNMARSVQIDSSTERVSPINYGAHPATQKFEKQRMRAEVLVMVSNRIMVTITVNNAPSEAAASGLGQYVNYAHLAKLVGG